MVDAGLNLVAAMVEKSVVCATPPLTAFVLHPLRRVTHPMTIAIVAPRLSAVLTSRSISHSICMLGKGKQTLTLSTAAREAEELLGVNSDSPPHPAAKSVPAEPESRVTRLAKREKDLRERARKGDIWGDDGGGVLSLSATKREVKRAFEDVMQARKQKRRMALEKSL